MVDIFASLLMYKGKVAVGLRSSKVFSDYSSYCVTAWLNLRKHFEQYIIRVPAVYTTSQGELLCDALTTSRNPLTMHA